jgi:hypothetical protein
VGHVELPAPVEATAAVWRLAQYAGGLFLPLRDGTAGDSSYVAVATRSIRRRAPTSVAGSPR